MGQEPLIAAQDVVIVLAALTAELHRHKQPSAPGVKLAFYREVAAIGGFERCEQCPSLSNELVKFEAKSATAIRSRQIARPVQQLAQALLAENAAESTSFGELLSGFGQCPRNTAFPAAAVFRFDAERRLGPSCQRVAAKIPFGGGENPSYRGDKFAPRWHVDLGVGNELFLDDLGSRHRMPEEATGEIGYCGAANLGRDGAIGDHGRARPDMHQSRSCAAFLQAADQHRYIGALPAAIGVQLVEYEKTQTAGSAVEKTLVFRPYQQQFAHHVIGQQDLWRVGASARAPSGASRRCIWRTIPGTAGRNGARSAL